MNIQDNIAYEYHIHSRNNKAYKHMKNEHFVHYRDDIKKITHSRAVEKDGEVFKLPYAKVLDNVTFNEVLLNRNSSRSFSKPISIQELATVLYYSNGLKKASFEQGGGERYNKFTPTSGAMNSVELFPIILNVEGLKNGVYYYNYLKHELININQGSYHKWLDDQVFFQREWTNSSVIIAVASAHGKLAKKYGIRAYRLSLLDVGLVAQNIYLVSSALELKVCASAGFIDDELDQALEIDGYEVATFLTTMIGK